jgi:RNA polymerase sigma factor (sigma-70 family)
MAVQAPRRAQLWRAADRRLAALAAAGEESAFDAIFERHHRGLLSFCRHMLGSPEEAEDALQHTFAAAYRQLVEHGPPRHLRAWLYATARNRCLDVLRAHREVPSELPEASTAGLADEVEQRSDLRDLVADIGRLPEDQRAALVMSEIEELGHAEVAEALGCPRAKVRALVYQARSSLAGWREARALPCREVREELAVARGAALRRGHLRRHLKLCEECAAFREDLDRQRRGIALVLPVLPALGLKERVLDAALGSAGAGAGGAAAGGAASGKLAGAIGPAAIKIGAAALVLGGAAGTFVGVSGGPEGEAPAASPAVQTSPAPERRNTTAEKRKAAFERRGEREATASPEGDAPEQDALDQPGQDPPASQDPGPAPAAPEGAPQDGGALPDVEAEAEVEVEVDPPDALP